MKTFLLAALASTATAHTIFQKVSLNGVDQGQLKGVRAPLIHQPWVDPEALTASGYPEPIVDLRSSREAALSAYRQMRVQH